ncbi:DUF1611 domain-containing protein [Roseiconus lacunae]|uniref:DUF1611 domain-containing protein n=1 Tax=Roseiconus lacunae TaxID=2605694 RepID=UPI001E4492AD|nr:DUF1611 domain-containing protein [Roseiconus lacunae]MCD0462429.1 DUF1611 domain-containing protein [Roseiconus lacunae]WRQ53220.1 DUF1611 domain-containing protein [Stieleria sp. HD01]
MSVSTTFPVQETHDESGANLTGYNRIVLLTDGYSTPFHAKTAISVLRYRSDDVVAVFETSGVGETAEALFGIGGSIPVVASLEEVDADAVFLGTAVSGGRLPEQWKPLILKALLRGVDVVSGNHQFLIDDPDFRNAAESSGARLIDIRRNRQNATSTGMPFREDCLRVHTVGQDCSLGKMVVSFEVQRELQRRGEDAHFIATGQTGIMISGEGIPVDCIVSDFVNGSVEALVRRNEGHDILLIEGQGSIAHPSFSAVTMGLLHGCAPQGLIYCYEVGRTSVKGLDHVPLVSHQKMIETYLANASLRCPSTLIGIALNGRNVSREEGEAERRRMESEFGLPTCDVYRDGAAPLADAVIKLRGELRS